MAKKQALALCGSLRADSWNGKLLAAFTGALETDGSFAVKKGPRLELPLMNEDLEKSPLDPKILELRAAIKESSIVIFASPEYNGAYTPALKNAIDWASRPPENVWAGKICVFLSASPGALGGARSLMHLRTLMGVCKAWVIPEFVQLPKAHEAFDAAGVLTNEQTKKQIQGTIASLKVFAERF